MARTASLALSLSLLALPASANTTIDHVHATSVTIVGVPGDLLTEGTPPGPPAPPVVAIPAALLGLVPGDDIDAVSWGNDPIGMPHRLVFSVGVGSVGAPGSGVAMEVGVGSPPSAPVPFGIAKPPEAAGDLFRQTGPAMGPCSNILAPSGSGYGAGSGNGDEFNATWATPALGVISDDLDAFDFTDPMFPPPGGVYFSLAPGSPSLIPLAATPGHILWSPLTGALPVIATLAGVGLATDVALGIPGANLDALNVAAAAPGLITAGATGTTPCGPLGGTHLVEYSVGPGGPFPPGDVLVRIGLGLAGVKLPGPTLGLTPMDNLDALEAVTLPVPALAPSAGPAGIALIVALLGGAGVALARRARRSA